MKNCRYLDKLDNSQKYVCTAFVDWWEKDTPKDNLYLTEENCICELYIKK